MQTELNEAQWKNTADCKIEQFENYESLAESRQEQLQTALAELQDVYQKQIAVTQSLQASIERDAADRLQQETKLETQLSQIRINLENSEAVPAFPLRKWLLQQNDSKALLYFRELLNWRMSVKH